MCTGHLRSVRYCRAEPLAAVLEYGRELVYGGGAEHGYARLAEVGYALEYGCGGEVSACVQYAALLVYALHIDVELLLEYVELLVEG